MKVKYQRALHHMSYKPFLNSAANHWACLHGGGGPKIGEVASLGGVKT